VWPEDLQVNLENMPETKIGWIRALPIQWPTIFCKIWKTFFKKSNYCFICFIVFFLNHIIPQSEIELELQALSYLLMSSYLDRGVLQKALFATVTQKHLGKVILLEPNVFSDVFQGQTWITMATSNACLVCIVLRPYVLCIVLRPMYCLTSINHWPFVQSWCEVFSWHILGFRKQKMRWTMLYQVLRVS